MVRSEWLSLTLEEALEPDLAICDPHHHLWDRAESRYLLQDLWQDTGSGHRVEETVFVECMAEYRSSGPPELRPVGETEFVRSVGEESAASRQPEVAGSGQPEVAGSGQPEVAGSRQPEVASIVGFADLTLGERVVPVLEAHVESGGGRFRGIRHAAGWDGSDDVRNSHTSPPQSLLLDAGFRRGFARLADYDLSFDAWLYHPQLPELVDLARAFPGTRIILDHVGGPLGIGPYGGRRDEVVASWKQGILELATCDNVAVKLGGLQMPICGFGWHKRDAPPTSAELAAATAPYYLYCIEQFGVDRCMFESNFPVDKVSCSYAVLWNTFKRVCHGFAVTEKQALFRDTALRVYRLQRPSG